MSVLHLLITLLIVVSAIPLLFSLRNGFKNINWIEFYSVGKDAGFSFKEIGLLKKAAVINRHQKPSSLFWSLDVLDKSIAGIHKKKDAEKDPEEKKYLDYLLKKIYSYRKKIEFQKPRYNRGLETTGEIPLNQLLKLKVDMVGVYECSVIENSRHYLLLTYPKGPPLPVGFSWRDRILNVYFWKKEDAGYFFQGRIMDGYPDRNFKTLRMTHSNVVLRSQKRRSVRTACEIPAQLYPVRSVHTATIIPESKPGLRCILQDLSEDGASLLIGGRGEKNMSLKLQFELYGKTTILRGMVRTIDYDSEKNISCLHIQAVEPDEESKYMILSFVYNIFRDDKKSVLPSGPEPVLAEEAVRSEDSDLETLEVIEEELPLFGSDEE
ncbi:MAG: hypothetical protein B6241_00685 [Spirochaetaceae bacterium 4572_59]|nr:MAG: hypothetical protein B6241_00685 [Spirochaetaceae bacterium 4572_59]